MKLIKMSYKGFVFYANPSSIKIQLSKHVSKRNIPFFYSKTQEICFKPAKITGNGCFTGNDAGKYADSLMRIFKSENSGYLFLPNSEPLLAYFELLDVSYDAEKNSVSYSFSFLEDCRNKKHSFNFGYTFALEGENLYDVANRTDVSIEKIVQCNDFRDLFSLEKGDRVRLC